MDRVPQKIRNFSVFSLVFYTLVFYIALGFLNKLPEFDHIISRNVKNVTQKVSDVVDDINRIETTEESLEKLKVRLKNILEEKYDVEEILSSYSKRTELTILFTEDLYDKRNDRIELKYLFENLDYDTRKELYLGITRIFTERYGHIHGKTCPGNTPGKKCHSFINYEEIDLESTDDALDWIMMSAYIENQDQFGEIKDPVTSKIFNNMESVVGITFVESSEGHNGYNFKLNSYLPIDEFKKKFNEVGDTCHLFSLTKEQQLLTCTNGIYSFSMLMDVTPQSVYSGMVVAVNKLTKDVEIPNDWVKFSSIDYGFEFSHPEGYRFLNKKRAFSDEYVVETNNVDSLALNSFADTQLGFTIHTGNLSELIRSKTNGTKVVELLFDNSTRCITVENVEPAWKTYYYEALFTRYFCPLNSEELVLEIYASKRIYAHRNALAFRAVKIPDEFESIVNTLFFNKVERIESHPNDGNIASIGELPTISFNLPDGWYSLDRAFIPTHFIDSSNENMFSYKIVHGEYYDLVGAIEVLDVDLGGMEYKVKSYTNDESDVVIYFVYVDNVPINYVNSENNLVCNIGGIEFSFRSFDEHEQSISDFETILHTVTLSNSCEI